MNIKERKLSVRNMVNNTDKICIRKYESKLLVCKESYLLVSVRPWVIKFLPTFDQKQDLFQIHTFGEAFSKSSDVVWMIGLTVRVNMKLCFQNYPAQCGTVIKICFCKHCCQYVYRD